jgi:hypothetical protein
VSKARKKGCFVSKSCLCHICVQLFAPSLPSSLHLLQSVEGRQQVMVAAGWGDKCFCRCVLMRRSAVVGGAFGGGGG